MHKLSTNGRAVQCVLPQMIVSRPYFLTRPQGTREKFGGWGQDYLVDVDGAMCLAALVNWSIREITQTCGLLPSESRSLLSKHGLKFVLHPNATYFSELLMILCDHDQMIFMLANCVTLE